MPALIRLLSLVFALNFSAQSIAAAPITELVSFGDSLSDNGNFAPYPPPFPGKTAYPQATWVKQLADKLKITPFEPSGTGATVAGSNYAFGGATTKYSVDRGWGYGSPFNQNNLTAQVSRYLDRTANPAGVKTGATALHVITIGGNDLIAASSQPAQIGSGWSTLHSAASLAAKSAESQVLVLAKAGAKKILWLNLPDYSASPFVRITSQKFGAYGPLYQDKLKAAVRAFNMEMDKAIVRLNAHPECAGLTLIKFDLEAVFSKIAASPSSYGFSNTTDNLTSIPMLALSPGNPAGNVDEYFFLDEIHPTFKAHALIAEEALRLLSVKLR